MHSSCTDCVYTRLINCKLMSSCLSKLCGGQSASTCVPLYVYVRAIAYKGTYKLMLTDLHTVGSTENLQATESLGMRLVSTTPTPTHTQLSVSSNPISNHIHIIFFLHHTLYRQGCWLFDAHLIPSSTFPPSLFPFVHYTQITSPPLTHPPHTHTHTSLSSLSRSIISSRSLFF